MFTTEPTIDTFEDTKANAWRIIPTLTPIDDLPETVNFAVVRTWTYSTGGRDDGYYGIKPKPCTTKRRTMIPLEQQQISRDLETVIKALMLTERKYLEWAQQNGEEV